MLSISSWFFPKTLFALCLSCCPQVTTSFCSRWSLPGWQWEILSNQTLNSKLGSGCPVSPKLYSFSSGCSNSSVQCSWKTAHAHLGRRHMLWRRLEAQFYLAFRSLLMPNYCYLCTFRLFSAQGRASTCFCHEWGVGVYHYCAHPLCFPTRVVLSFGEFVLLLLPPHHMRGCVRGPVLCWACLPAAGLELSITRCANAELSPGHLHC